MQTTIKLSQIKPGSAYPGGSVNMRTTAKTDGIAALAAMIRSQITDDNPTGILQNLLVCPDPKKPDIFYVIDGDRRLAALTELSKEKDVAIGTDAPVPVTILKDVTPGSAIAASITANTYLPPHPIDQFEAFARCAREGMTEDAIAERFGVKLKLIKQRLALGNLSPKIRADWRDGKLNQSIVEAFTLAKDHKTQERIYADLRKRHDLHAAAIRRQIGAADSELAEVLAFVGKDAYKAAGGAIVEDLFGDNHAISDSELLNKLALEKLEAERTRLTAEGWAFVVTEEDAGYFRLIDVKVKLTTDEKRKIGELRAKRQKTRDWQVADAAEAEINSIESAARARSITPEQRAKSGVLLSVEGGAFRYAWGVTKPKISTDSASQRAAAANQKKAAKAKKPGDLSEALRQDLSERLTRAAGDAITSGREPDLAISLVIAALSSSDSPVRITASGFGQHPATSGKLKFGDALREALAMSSTKRGVAVAELVGPALNMTFRATGNYNQTTNDGAIAALRDKIDAKLMNAALRKNFDAKDYFTRASSVNAQQALDDMGVAKPTALKKKDQLVAFVVDHAKKTGWLPKELRTAHYDGPVAKAKRPAKASPKKKSPAKARPKAKPAPKKRAAKKAA